MYRQLAKGDFYMKKVIFKASVSFYERNVEKERVNTERNTHRQAERAIRKIIKLHKETHNTSALQYVSTITTLIREQ